MDLVRRSWLVILKPPVVGGRCALTLRLALRHLPYFLLHGSARHSRRAFGFRGRFLARGAFELLALYSVFHVFRIHSFMRFNPLGFRRTFPPASSSHSPESLP